MVEQPPAAAGIQLTNWYWRVVRQFVSERFGISLCRSSCLNWLHRLGFAFKRPKKRLVKANESKREAFVAEYAALWEEAQRTEARIFFADEAHFRADAELRGKWVLKGKPALVDSNSPRYGEKASYYSAVCLETGEVEWMELEGNSNSGTSVAFLTQLKEKRPGPLRVIWDNAPAHRGEAVREYLRTPELELRLVNLPGYRPDFNADEAIWGWAREEATGNLCLGSRAAVQERVGKFLAGLSSRKDEVRRRCRTVLQSRTETLPPRFPAPGKCTSHLGFGLVCSPRASYSEIWDVDFSASDPDIIMAATLDSPGPSAGSNVEAELYRSTDGGQTWTQLNCGFTTWRVASVRIDPSNPAVAVLEGGLPSFTGPGDDQYYGGGIYRTEDRGQNWSRVSLDPNDGRNGYVVMRRTQGGQLVTFGTNRDGLSENLGFMRSNNMGRTWEFFAPELRTRSIDSFDLPADGRSIYANEDGIYFGCRRMGFPSSGPLFTPGSVGS